MVSLGTLYLAIAALLIFGAAAYAVKRIFRHLSAKRMTVIGFVTLTALVLIWIFLGYATKKRESVELLPDTSAPTPALPSNPD
jgi:uncharacterized membrane protein